MTRPAAGDGAVVAVMGGGITGLVAAYRLTRAGLQVELIEASERLGGKVLGTEVDGVAVEAGPDSFLTRDAGVIELCEELDLAGDLVEPAVFGARILLDGVLRPVPPGLPYGLPIRPWTAWRAGLLSNAGALRAALEPVVGRPLEGDDVSVADLVTTRFGRQALERIVDPLLAGTRAGAPEDMSLAAALPTIDAAARSDRSVGGALRANDPGPPSFLGLRRGFDSLVARLQERMTDVGWTLDARVDSVERCDGRHRIALSDGRRAECDAIVLAVPAFEAARILARAYPRAATPLSETTYASCAVITLVYPPGPDGCPPGTSGVLLPSAAHRAVTAWTWYARKWPHTAPDDGRVVIRAFVGRAERTATLDASDDALVARVAAEIEDVVRLDRAPVAHRVTRWERALPQYRVGHPDRMADADAALPPTIALAGAGYRGSGLPDCIAQAQSAAARVLHALGAGDASPTSA